MNPTDLTSRVTLESGCLVAALGLLAGWVGGITAAAGVGAGGALAIVNFRFLSGRTLAVLAGLSGHGPRGGWALGFGLRLGALGAVTAGLLMSGWAHPVGLVVGLTVLPWVLIVRGLVLARQGS
ncbi:MAG: ATP synthase subunit I [Candidatus Rokuibacteriota bacterium]